tara:strand:+ start:932 stop:1939 length:1008 start_codon:yes stop_codon:yes gene_type:complete
MKLSDLENIDVKNMFKTYDNWPQIARESFENRFEKIDVKNIDHLVFAGMGGSGTIGDTIKAILSKEDIHVSVVKGYLLPKTVDDNTLVVTTSVSGNTSETLEIIKSVKKKNAKIASFASGGLIEKYCKNNDMFFQNIPFIHSPRASFSSFLFSIINIFEYILPIKKNDIYQTISTLEETKQNIFSENLNENNKALNLAEFTNDIVSIFYPAGLQAAAIRYKNSLQENTKIHAMIDDVMEASHNAIVAWESESSVSPVFIQGIDDHIKTIERWNIMKEFFDSKRINYHVVNSTKGNILAKIVNLIYLLDYSTIYAAVIHKIDPSPVKSIDFIKSKL